jgi:hypothetical protein
MAAEQAEQAPAHAETGEIVGWRRCRRAPGKVSLGGSIAHQISVPANASTRMTSPSRTRASGPPASASGPTWITAGTLPDAPDMRPSVTSATLRPASCSAPSAG